MIILLLVIHIMVAVALVGVILLQKSEAGRSAWAAAACRGS
jgi:protein translocase SecG subunit